MATEVLILLPSEYGIFEKHMEFLGIPQYFYSKIFLEFCMYLHTEFHR